VPAQLNYKAAQSRKVSPQSQRYQSADQARVETAADEGANNLSKVVPAEAEFRQLIGEQADGILARFLQNKLKLMCWHRLRAEPDLIFGAQLSLDQVVAGLRGLVQPDRAWGNEICLAVLDDNAKPVVLSRAAFQANWKRPFVATEVGEALPHWEAAAYLVNPAQLLQVARTAKLTLGLLVAVLLIAIGTGSLLIVRSLGAELKLARQKTDFVGNVSHELKTPLTSIRMFSELLAEGRVADPAKQHSYLQIISAEAARLTRLINNVLDFSRMERGEKKYHFQPCDLTELVRATAETFRPHLESSGFQFVCELPATRIPVRGDADALSQIIVNLLSNAEKYSAPSERRAPPRPVEVQAGVRALACSEDRLKPELQPSSEPGPETGAPPKEIVLQLAQKQSPLPYAEIKVLDRGPGVPRGCEEKVFEKFYRAHDSLSSGVQGSGLGLTIARQIARAHGGEVVYEPRDRGGSCFVLRLPIQLQTTAEAQ
jgi:signal transduction histidine kinase